MQNFLIKTKVTQLSLICCLLLMLACGKERTNIVAKAYHKTTSYFNGYYNANEILKATTKMIDEQYQYPGGGLFEIYYIGNEEQVKNFEGDFDKIIEKNDIVIYKHPNGGFADDCRFMNGQSHYYKKDFRKAMENFDYVIETYPESKIIPKTYLWKAMTHYEAGNPELAIDILEKHIFPYDTIEFDKKGALDMAIFQSKLAIDSSNYPAAAKRLAPIVDDVKGRQNRAKAHFLLAQLYAEADDFPQSFEHFELVEKYSQDYDLTFMSKMKIAHLYIDFSEGQDDDMKVFEYLSKLLKDEKNIEYADQILYELGQLELKKDSVDNALDYFRESITANQGKPRFRALSSYAIGKVYFERYQQYDSAQVYFDAAANSITKNDAEYKEITTLAKTLRNYVTFKNTIAYQDSMLYLYSLSEEDLEKAIAKVAEEEERKKQEKLRAEQAKKAQEERELRENMGGNGGRGMNNSFMNNFGERNSQQAGASNWYFDNPTAVTQGITAFQTKWGRRTNEDHWRRSRKALSNLAANGEQGGEAELSPEKAKADSVMKEEFGDNFKYYVDIPKNSDDSLKSEIMIEEAMYGLGRIFAQKLNEPDSAIKTFEALLDRYENSDFDLRSRYALYQLYMEADNPIFNVHRNFILNEHPKSIYAYLILGKDPNELKEEENNFSYAYTGLLSSYRNRQYETAIGFSEFLLGQFGTDNPKLDYAELHYIRGMSYGYMGNRDSLRDILTYVVNAFPEADVTPVAKITLDYMQTGKAKGSRPTSSTNKAQSKEKGDGSLTDPNNERYEGFAVEPKTNDKIFVLMYIDQKNVSKGDATSKVSNFNKDKFSKLNLKTFTFLYKSQYLLPYISHFTTEEEAAAYVKSFLANPISKELLPSETDRVFYISHSNFKVAYGRKRMEDYMLYFENIIDK